MGWGSLNMGLVHIGFLGMRWGSLGVGLVYMGVSGFGFVHMGVPRDGVGGGWGS